MSLSLIAFHPAIERAVEHEAVGQHVLVDHAGDHRQMLPFALGIGEAQVDIFDLIFFDLLQHFGCGARHDGPRLNEKELPWLPPRFPGSDSSAARRSHDRGEYLTRNSALERGLPVLTERPAVEPADADQADAKGDKRSDPKQAVEPGGVEQEHLGHCRDHHHEGSDPPVSGSSGNSPQQEADRQDDGHDRTEDILSRRHPRIGQDRAMEELAEARKGEQGYEQHRRRRPEPFQRGRQCRWMATDQPKPDQGDAIGRDQQVDDRPRPHGLFRKQRVVDEHRVPGEVREARYGKAHGDPRPTKAPCQQRRSKQQRFPADALGKTGIDELGRGFDRPELLEQDVQRDGAHRSGKRERHGARVAVKLDASLPAGNCDQERRGEEAQKHIADLRQPGNEQRHSHQRLHGCGGPLQQWSGRPEKDDTQKCGHCGQ